MKGYDPYSGPKRLARIELDKADDMGYLIKYWRAIGKLPLPGIPAIESLDSWEEGLKLD